MSTNALSDIKELVLGNQRKNRTAVVVEIISSDSVIVVTDGDRVVISAKNLIIGQKVFISGSTFISKSEDVAVTFFTE